jgi:hypothetical protein
MTGDFPSRVADCGGEEHPWVRCHPMNAMESSTKNKAIPARTSLISTRKEDYLALLKACVIQHLGLVAKNTDPLSTSHSTIKQMFRQQSLGRLLAIHSRVLHL